MELKSSELRIGNLVFDRGLAVDLKPSQLVNIIEGKYPFAYKPIPLHEEWFLEFGFEKSLDYWMKSNSNFFFGITEKGDLMYLFDEDMICPARIKHVHELQNLYFALTGKELQITETAQ